VVGGFQSRNGGAPLLRSADSGSAYVAGFTNSRDFPVTSAFQPKYGGGAYDGFIAKLHILQIVVANASAGFSVYVR
jgi:hypothetical protein